MHAIGDGVDGVLAVHGARYFTVALRHTVDVIAVVESEHGEIQCSPATHLGFSLPQHTVAAQHGAHQFQRKAVVTRLYWGVGGKYTAAAHLL